MCLNGYCPAVQHDLIGFTDEDHLSKRFVKTQSPFTKADILWSLDRPMK